MTDTKTTTAQANDRLEQFCHHAAGELALFYLPLLLEGKTDPISDLTVPVLIATAMAAHANPEWAAAIAAMTAGLIPDKESHAFAAKFPVNFPVPEMPS